MGSWETLKPSSSLSSGFDVYCMPALLGGKTCDKLVSFPRGDKYHMFHIKLQRLEKSTKSLGLHSLDEILVFAYENGEGMPWHGVGALDCGLRGAAFEPHWRQENSPYLPHLTQGKMGTASTRKVFRNRLAKLRK